MKRVPIRCSCTSPELIPRYQYEGSSGADLHADIPEEQPITINPGRWERIPTGLRLEIPRGYEAQVRPRSGLSSRHGVTILNTPGTVDSDYRGEIKVVLVNLGESEFVIQPGMRIAQIVFAPIARIAWRVVEELPATERGQGGFGHTGQ